MRSITDAASAQASEMRVNLPITLPRAGADFQPSAPLPGSDRGLLTQ